MAQEINDNLDTVGEALNNEAAPEGGTTIRHSNACSPCCGAGGLFASLFGSASPNPAATTSTTSPAIAITATAAEDVLTAPSFSHSDILLDTFSSSTNGASNVPSPFSKRPIGKAPASVLTSVETPSNPEKSSSAPDPRLIDVETGESLEPAKGSTPDDRRGLSIGEYFSERLDSAVDRFEEALEQHHQSEMQVWDRIDARQESSLSIAKNVNAMLDEALMLLGGTSTTLDPTSKDGDKDT